MMPKKSTEHKFIIFFLLYFDHSKQSLFIPRKYTSLYFSLNNNDENIWLKKFFFYSQKVISKTAIKNQLPQKVSLRTSAQKRLSQKRVLGFWLGEYRVCYYYPYRSDTRRIYAGAPPKTLLSNALALYSFVDVLQESCVLAFIYYVNGVLGILCYYMGESLGVFKG